MPTGKSAVLSGEGQWEPFLGTETEKEKDRKANFVVDKLFARPHYPLYAIRIHAYVAFMSHLYMASSIPSSNIMAR